MANSVKVIGIKEIAEEAGVSMGTVDRVLHKRFGVNHKTRIKVENIIKKYKYEPNILAKRLASKSKIRLASLLPSVSKETQYWELPLKGITQAEEEIKHYGIEIEKYFYDFVDVQSFQKAAKKILVNKYDGIIIAPTFIKETKEFCLLCDKKRVPYVFIDTDIADANNLTYIGPNLFKSGYAIAHLLDYIVNDNDVICLINISQYADIASDAKSKEDGFRYYFSTSKKKLKIHRLNINSRNNSTINKNLKSILEQYSPRVAIVINSRAFHLGKVMVEIGNTNTIVMGYDCTEKNISYLKNGKIDFLICHRSKEQGYLSVMALYNILIKGSKVEKVHHTSIDIITKENYEFY